MNRLYRFFRSVRLAVVLLLTLTVLSILSTLVPQGQPEDYYRAAYPPGLAALVLGLRFHRFFTTALFIAPVLLFIGNLGTCTVDRLVRRARGRAAHRHGPDLVHIALLVLTIGGVTSLFVRREKYFTMGVGDTVEITGGYRMELLSFEFQRYEGGRPKDWISRVRVRRGGTTLRDDYHIEVNRPLRLGLLRVYQSSYDTEGRVLLSDPQGGRYAIGRGDGVPSGDTALYLVAFEPAGPGSYMAVFQRGPGPDPGDLWRIVAGGSLGAYRVDGVEARDLTGLTAVRDPGVIPVLAALLLGSVGLALTALQRRGETST